MAKSPVPKMVLRRLIEQLMGDATAKSLVSQPSMSSGWVVIDVAADERRGR